MSYSVIIPAHNCQRTVAQSIKAVLAAIEAYRRSEPHVQAELIIINDGSTDQTEREILQFPDVRYDKQPNMGPATARNKGAQLARNSILVFTDSDCLPRIDWLQKLSVHFTKPAIAVVSGSYGIANPENWLAKGIHGEIIYRHTHLMSEYPTYFGSFNVAIRKEIFLQLGGFDMRYQNASSEDNDLSYRITAFGLKIYFAKDALVDHYHPEILGTYLKQQYRHGYWRAYLYWNHPTMAKGDGYTFWKDPTEVLLVLCIYFFLAISLLGFATSGVVLASCALMALVLINTYYALKFLGSGNKFLYYATAMIVRAFARTNGFLIGCCAVFFCSNGKNASKTEMPRIH